MIQRLNRRNLARKLQTTFGLFAPPLATSSRLGSPPPALTSRSLSELLSRRVSNFDSEKCSKRDLAMGCWKERERIGMLQRERERVFQPMGSEGFECSDRPFQILKKLE